jgi:ABC-2 type transport system permease protein
MNQIKNIFKKLGQKQYWWVLLLLIFALIIGLSNLFFGKKDMTAEKRFSLSDASKNVLKQLKAPITIDVFLQGQFPAGFKRIANTTKEFLDECKRYSNGKLSFRFVDPFKVKKDEELNNYLDSIGYFYGITPMKVGGNLQSKVGEEITTKDVLPGAIVSSSTKKVGVNLLAGVQQFGSEEEQLAQMYNQVETVLENKFIDAINKAAQVELPKIAYALGHGELFGFAIDDAFQSLRGKSEQTTTYLFDTLNIKTAPFIPESVDALVILKPTKPFNDADKLKIDQYVMRGGAVFWMVDNMYAEFDSLMRAGNQGFVAYDRQLNLDDLLFNYGVRINQNLLQDLQADQLPLLSGNNSDGSQGDMFSFSFMPVLNNGNHIITKNIGNVRAMFPNTIDTIKTPGIKKSILLKSSSNAKIIGTPYKVDFSFIQYANDAKQFTVKDTAVAVLLEGKFNSLFKNKIGKAELDSLAAYKRPFVETANNAGKMIVVADGDIATNWVVPDENGRPQPLQMGQNRYTGYTFANKQFFTNCIEYLIDNENILASRNKDYTLRLMDPVKKDANSGLWKFLTTVVPLLLLVIIGLITTTIRKRRYIK